MSSHYILFYVFFKQTILFHICTYVCVCHVCCILFTNSMAGLLQSCSLLFQIWNSFIGGPETGYTLNRRVCRIWHFFYQMAILGVYCIYTPFSDTQPHIIYSWLCIRYYLPSVIWCYITCWLVLLSPDVGRFHQLYFSCPWLSIQYPSIIRVLSINFPSIIHPLSIIIHPLSIIIPSLPIQYPILWLVCFPIELWPIEP